MSDVLFFMKPGNNGFQDVDDLTNNYCNKVPGWLKEIYTFKSCLKPFPRTIFHIIIRNIRVGFKKFCGDQEKRVVTMSHLRCLNNSTKDTFVDLGNKITSVLYHISYNITDLNDVIPGACCAVNIVIPETKSDLERTCAGLSPPNTPEFFIDFVKAVMSDAIDIVCGKYNSPEICLATQPGITRDIMDSLKKRRSLYENTLIVPLLDIINKLDNNVNLDE